MRMITRRQLCLVAIPLVGASLLTACTKSGGTGTKAASASPAASAFTPSASAPLSSPAPSAPALSAAPPSAVSSPALTSPSVASPAPSDTAAAASASATARLTAITLHDDDLPGWTGADYQANPKDAAYDAALFACVGARNTDPDRVAQVDSQDYSLGDASIGSNASLYLSPADLVADTATIRSPKASRCYTTVVRGEFSDSLPDGTTVNSTSIVITPGTGGGPRNVVAHGSGRINITSGGQVVDLYLNVVFITGPLIETEVNFENIGAPVPLATRTAIVAKVAARAAAGQTIASSGAPDTNGTGKPAAFQRLISRPKFDAG